MDFESMYTVINDLGIRGYRLRRMNILRRIWKDLVPEQGQSEWLQGELLRQIEKLRNEALGNGNINWDDNYAWFCDFISDTLKESGVFEEQEIKIITGALKYIRDCGEYARSYREGKYPMMTRTPCCLPMRIMICMTLWPMRSESMPRCIRTRSPMRKRILFTGKTC